MSTKIKLYLMAGLLSMIGATNSFGQATVELGTFPSGTFNPGNGPTIASQGPILLAKDALNNNVLAPSTGNDLTTVTFSLSNQQYTGLPYSNISTGLVFGAQPTDAFSGTVQKVDVGSIYSVLGEFITNPGGPTSNFFTAAAPPFATGTGIVSGADFFELGERNGAVFLFTNAQWQHDRPGAPGGGPWPNQSDTRYYYGDLVINFNRFIATPIIHIAGLGGSYRYIPANSPNTDPSVQANYVSTFFSTELEIVGFTGTKISGNGALSVVGSSITNSLAAPSGASVSTLPAGTVFDENGAASGSIRINAAVKTITLRVYLRGRDASQFDWSAYGAPTPVGGPNQQVFAGQRNPLTGDIWAVSASAQATELIFLPSTGLNLTAALNGNNVNLNWKTQSESNSKEYEIERSTDGVNFTLIGNKPAAGNSSTVSNYAHTDPNMNASVYYYRVKLVDGDGRYAYSNIAIVRKTGVKGVKAFPNPAISQLNLEFSNLKGAYSISLYNINGQEVVKQTATISSTVQYVPVNRNSLPAGTYSVRVRNADNTEVYTEKVVFQ